MAEETGDWTYLVIDPNGMRAREDANYCRETKRQDANFRFKEGTVVTVNRRRTAGWTKWLALRSGEGWLFDVSPKDKKVRLVECEAASGSWLYECLVDQVQILQKPVFSAGRAAKAICTGTLGLKELVQIQERVRPVNGKGSFLRLADGRGWILDFVDGCQILQRQCMPSDMPPVADADPHGFGRSVASPFSTSSSSSFSRSNKSGGYVAGGSPSKGASDTLGGTSGLHGQPECGEWEYVVVDPKGLSLRSSATYDTSQKISKRIEEGEVVTVVERIPGDCITFLRLTFPQGWCFDRQPGEAKKARLRMMEIKVDRGRWYYLVLAERGVAVRARCSFSESAKTGKGPLKGALVEVTERVRAGESTFLRLKDGGWVFDVKNGKRILQGPIDVQALPSNTLGCVQSQGLSGNNERGGILLSSSPTNQKWAVTKFFLLNSSKVHVNSLCEVDGIRWTCVSKPGGGGIEGWAPSDSILMVAEGTIPSSDFVKSTWSTNAAAFAASDSMRANAATNAFQASQPPQPPDVCQPLRQAAPPAPVPLGLGLSPAPAQMPAPAPPTAHVQPQPAPKPMPSPEPKATVVATPAPAALKLVANPALAAAMAAGFTMEPGQAPHSRIFGMAPTAPVAFEEPSEQTNCPGCGLTITPLNTFDGRCKSCKHRYGNDPLALSPVRAAVAWVGHAKMGQVR